MNEVGACSEGQWEDLHHPSYSSFAAAAAAAGYVEEDGESGAEGACLGAVAAGVAGSYREDVQVEAKSRAGREGRGVGEASSSCLVAFPGEEAACGKDAAERDDQSHWGFLPSLVVVAGLDIAALDVVAISAVAAFASSSAFRGAVAAAVACVSGAGFAAAVAASAVEASVALARMESQISRLARSWCLANHSIQTAAVVVVRV